MCKADTTISYDYHLYHNYLTQYISAVIQFSPGLQPDLCIKVYPPTPILTMALNPSAGLLALGKVLINAVMYLSSF